MKLSEARSAAGCGLCAFARTHGAAASYAVRHGTPTACRRRNMNHREPPIDCNPLNSTAPIAQPAPTKPAAWFSAARSRPAPCRKGAGAAPLPLPLNAELRFAGGSGPRIALYLALPDDSVDARRLTPLVVVHSVNAAASAAEVRPVFERLRATRPVLALELPGFGMSQRGPLVYMPQAMAAAIFRRRLPATGGIRATGGFGATLRRITDERSYHAEEITG